MAKWRKLLDDMVADTSPTSYTYDQAAMVLEHLGFALAKPVTGSHRRFRRVTPDTAKASGTRSVVIGLVQKGHGTLKPVYIREMVRVLRENHLLPNGVDET